MRGLLATSLILISASAMAQGPAMSRAVQTEFVRVDQRVDRLQEENDLLKQQLRALEKDNQKLHQLTDDLIKKHSQLLDSIVRLENVDISNLRNAQKRLYDQVPVLNWGAETRDCLGIGSHQQINSVRSEDGNFTLRYLCYDGKALHLGTESHNPPE
jgi:hypothetical protein